VNDRSLLYRGILILVVVALAAWSAYPLNEKINLGLDLRGGMHLVLEVQTEDAVVSELDRAAERIAEQAREEGLTGVQVNRGEDDTLVVTGVERGEGDAAIGRIRQDFLGEEWDWDRVGDRIVFELSAGGAETVRRQAVRQALQTINNRIDQFGVAEPLVAQIGSSDRIVVQLPGVDDPERIRELIKSTAFLEFRLTTQPAGGGSGLPSRQAVLDAYNGQLPPNVEILEGDVTDPEGRAIGTQYFGVERQSVVTGRDLKNARPSLGEFNEPVVQFTLSAEAGQRFGDTTGANIGRGLAIILDDRVVSAPVIQDQIRDSGIIRGQFTQAEVEDLSLTLRSGALPAGIVYLEERTVGPSLGRDSIEQGLRAGLIGFALVILAMLVVYKRTGLNAVLALGLNVVLVFGALAYFNATLTLPGIAGIILVIGMAVDANVLVFERIREELRAGRTVKSAVDAGFAKALSSIIDANVTTLIAALFLFQFGTGPIRGFAVTLTIGIFASVFTAVFVSRWIFDLMLSRRERVERLSI
jgi:preprotein translocase subunit SecD